MSLTTAVQVNDGINALEDRYDTINARQFYDFVQPQDEEDDFFLGVYEKPAENEVENFSTGKEHDGKKEMFRRSMSHGDLQFLETALIEKHISRNNNSYVVNEQQQPERISEGKENQPLQSTARTYRSNSTNSLKNMHQGRKTETYKHRSISSERLRQLSKPKQQFNNYVPMAEALFKLQKTPDRFRLRLKSQQQEKTHHEPLKAKHTRPITPNLCTATRSRSSKHVESAEEKEKKEIEEMERYKFKANPINEKVLSGPPKNTLTKKKGSTVPAPFKITEVKHKPVEVNGEIKPEFHAKPVPKAVIEGPKKLEVKHKLPTVPHTPQFMRNYFAAHPRSSPLVKLDEKPAHSTDEKFIKKKTEPKPFSFEVRDRMMLKKKEQKIEEFHLEMKKQAEFRANPIPKGILESKKNTSRNGSCNNLNQTTSEPTTMQFKARPATVLQKKPFEPKKPDKPPTAVQEFKLKTDLRAAEREEFERYQREKEELKEKFFREQEERRRKEEEEEALRQRKEAEFQAQPVRKYKPLPAAQQFRELTIPESPNFCLKERRKAI